MTDTFPLVLFVLFDVVFGCQVPPWVLKRADPGSSGVSFYNNTVSDSYTMARWTWRDSSGGFWDTRLRVTLDNEEIIGGGFTYSDQYENELASVRWFKIRMDGQIRWKYNSFASPPESWWMSSVVPWGNITWGFKNQITDGSWVFKVGNDTLEPKNVPNVDGWSQNTGNRWKRSLKSHELDAHSSQTKRYLTDVKGGQVEYDDDDDYDGGGGIVETIINNFLGFTQISKIEDDLTTIG